MAPFQPAVTEPSDVPAAKPATPRRVKPKQAPKRHRHGKAGRKARRALSPRLTSRSNGPT